MIYVTNCIFNVKIIDLLKQTFFCPFEQKFHGCKRVRFSVVFHLKMYKKVLICDQLKQIIFYLSLSNIKVQTNLKFILYFWCKIFFSVTVNRVLPWILSLTMVMSKRVPEHPHDRIRMILESFFRSHILRYLSLYWKLNINN